MCARDVLRELLDEQRLADHDLVDRLVEELGEAGHVDAFLRRVEIDVALDRCGDERSPPPWRIRTAFSTPVTPARERLILTSGVEACRSWLNSLSRSCGATLAQQPG